MYFVLKKKSEESIQVFCSDIKNYLPYKTRLHPKSIPLHYDSELASFLLTLDLNVTLHNCSNLGSLPNPPGFNITVPLKGSDGKTLAFLFASPSVNIISFTGTFFFGQWLSDLDASQVPPRGIGTAHYTHTLVHSGFYKLYMSIQEKLHEALKKYPSSTLFITGHSLGGALANLCAYDLASSFKNMIVYTFAAPRLGNLAFASAYDNMISKSNSYRIFNTEDVVPDTPPPILGNYIYEHVGVNVPFTDNLGSLTKNHINAYEKFYGI